MNCCINNCKTAEEMFKNHYPEGFIPIVHEYDGCDFCILYGEE